MFDVGTVTISTSEYEKLFKAKEIVKSIIKNYQIHKDSKGDVIAEGFVLDQKLLEFYFPEECEKEIKKVREAENV